MNILVIAEHDNQSLNAATRNVVAAASQLGGTLTVLVAGYQAGNVASAAAQIAGVSRVLHADGTALANPLAENLAAQVLAVATGFDAIFAAATTTGKNFLPRVAAKLDVAMVSEITAVKSADTFVRPIYAGNVLATVKSNDAIKVLTVRTTAFEPAAATGGSATIETVAAVSDSGKSRFVSSEITQSDRPDLASARVVVTGGRALASAENYQSVLSPLADKLGAALGASRAAVDAGYAPNDYQVGQTGKIVAPDLYFAIGVSGAIQHLAGMKDSKVIVAINKDPDAPIFQVADYGLVADLFEAVPALVAAL